MVFTIVQKVNKHLGYFFNKICSQEIPKIVQSGHTEGKLPSKLSTYERTFLYYIKNARSKEVAKAFKNLNIWVERRFEIEEE